VAKALRTRTKLARRLRRDATNVERILWFALRERLPAWKFRRQHPIGGRVVDFACPERKLAIELDGGQHALREEADEHRSAELAERGYRVVRFWNSDVLNNLDGVLETLIGALGSDPPPPAPLNSPIGNDGSQSNPSPPFRAERLGEVGGKGRVR
jgi:very-short-patch-repair endonuclease